MAAVLLDEQNGVDASRKEFATPPPDGALPGPSASRRLFALDVERTDSSQNREQAAVRFEGFRALDGVSQRVLSRTVRAKFVDHQVRLVRVFLGRACVSSNGEKNCEAGTSCDYATGSCAQDAELPSEELTDELAGDAGTAWTPVGYPACGLTDAECPANCTPELDPDCKPAQVGVCEPGKLDCSSEVPGCETPADSDPECRGVYYPTGELMSSTKLPAGQLFMRRVVVESEAVVAIGLVFAAPTAGNVRFVLAEDRDSRPGRVIEVRNVDASAGVAEASDAYRVEFRFEKPVEINGSIFWIGVELAQTGSVRTRVTDGYSWQQQGNVSPRLGVGSEPYEGGVAVLDGENVDSPHLYTVYFEAR